LNWTQKRGAYQSWQGKAKLEYCDIFDHTNLAGNKLQDTINQQSLSWLQFECRAVALREALVSDKCPSSDQGLAGATRNGNIPDPK